LLGLALYRLKLGLQCGSEDVDGSVESEGVDRVVDVIED
jgi:hypothetical protein